MVLKPNLAACVQRCEDVLRMVVVRPLQSGGRQFQAPAPVGQREQHLIVRITREGDVHLEDAVVINEAGLAKLIQES